MYVALGFALVHVQTSPTFKGNPPDFDQCMALTAVAYQRHHDTGSPFRHIRKSRKRSIQTYVMVFITAAVID